MSVRAIGWVGVAVQRGQSIAGSRSTSLCSISNEEPPAPTTRPARRVVTGTPCAARASSTSRRLARCLESRSVSGIRPPR